MATKKKRNNAAQMASDQSIVEGLVKHAATLLTLAVGGGTMKASDLVVVLQARIAAIKAAIAARAALMAAVAAEHAEIAKTAVMISGARQALKIMFAGQPDLLADFGIAPPKPRTPLTAEQKALAKAKAAATRKANHPAKGSKATAATQAVAAAAAAAVEAQQAPAATAPAVTPPGGTSTPKS
jgi:hypothetical protein